MFIKNIQKPKKLFLICATLFILFCGIIISLTIYTLINGAKHQATITNINEYLDHVPSKTKVALQQQLKFTLTANGVSQGATVNDATIREGSFTETSEQKKSTATFLIDIPSAQMTFWASVSWSNDTSLTISNPILIECPLKDESMFPETPCKSWLTSNDETPAFVYWENLYQLSYTYGQGTTNKIISALEDFILNNYHRDSMDSGITVIVDETSLSQVNNQPGITFTLNINTHNHKLTSVIQTDESFGNKYIFAYLQDDTTKKYTAQLLANDQSIISSISNWAKNYFNDQSIKITVNPLN